MSERPDGVDLGELSGPMGLLSYARGISLAEAAAVMFEHRAHRPGVRMHVQGHFDSSLGVVWDSVSTAARASWYDIQDATEHGACACAIVLLRRLAGLVVVQQSRKGTGFDWWLGSARSRDGIFQDMHRLEVSGILQGAASDVDARLNAKLAQLRRSSDTRLPGWAVVVEFGTPLAMIVLV